MRDTAPQKHQDLTRIEFRSYTPGDETRIVQILGACHKQGWQDEEYWRWKHLARPGFEGENVVLAFVEGEMAGCFHGAIFPLTLEAGLEIPMNFEGDFAVLPEYRKLAIPDQAHDLISRRLLDQGVMLRGGFTSRELNERFYHKRFGYIFVPTVTTQFRKILSLRLLKGKVEAYGSNLLSRSKLHRVLRQPVVIDLRIETFPPCRLELTDQAVRFHEGVAEEADLRISISYGVLVAMLQGRRSFAKAAVSNFLMGRLRIAGLFRMGMRFLLSRNTRTVKH